MSTTEFAPTHILVNDFRIAGLRVQVLDAESEEVKLWCKLREVKRTKSRLFYTIDGNQIDGYVTSSYAKPLAKLTPREVCKTMHCLIARGYWVFTSSGEVDEKEIGKRQSLMVCDYKGNWKLVGSLRGAIGILNRTPKGARLPSLFGYGVTADEVFAYKIDTTEGVHRLNFIGHMNDKKLATGPLTMAMMRMR